MMEICKTSKGYKVTFGRREIQYLMKLTRNHEKSLELVMHESTTAIQLHEVNDERKKVKEFADKFQEILLL